MTGLAHNLDCLDNDVLPDSMLVQLAQQGLSSAFEKLVHRHHSKAVGLAMRMMRNEAVARDAVQDAWLNAWRKLDSFRGDSAFSSWLFRIVHNACLMRMRSRRRRPEVSLEVQLGGDETFERQIQDNRPLADELYDVTELAGALDAAIQTLTPNYRHVFELADRQHMSMKDIAQRLDLSVPNVKTRLHRARLRLRTELRPFIDAEPVCVAAA
ncbi:MAG: RNA polymerase sigma-70 factor (ECF subfamily) [Kiritimatiellia bacterium]|jgi:RNA polymerase sigma-70 factor (ECF subfamily)